MDVGVLINAARKKRNMTLRDLSDKSGISYSQISKIERGENVPGESTIIKLAEALELNELIISKTGIKSIEENLFLLRRYQAFIRDNFTCQLCGGKAPDVPVNVSGIENNDAKEEEQSLESLITLCEDCKIGRKEFIKVEGIEKDPLLIPFKNRKENENLLTKG